jgi:hypothetical protein
MLLTVDEGLELKLKGLTKRWVPTKWVSVLP